MQLAHQPLWNHNLEFVETWNIITNSRKKVHPSVVSSCSAVYMFPCHFETQRHNITIIIIIINLPIGSEQINSFRMRFGSLQAEVTLKFSEMLCHI